MKTFKVARAKPVRSADFPTVIEFLLDETGSMGSCREATIGGFNEYINTQRGQPGKCLLTLTKFDTTGLKTPYTDIDIQLVPHLDTNTYIPGQSTNLFDAIGTRIVSLEQRLQTHNWPAQPHVLFIIMTDGQDNASREHSAASIKTFTSKKESEGWTFVYLGANQDAWKVGETFGMSKGNTMTYNTAQTRETMRSLSESQTAYRAVRASGEMSANTASKDFFAKPEAEKKTKSAKYIKGVTADSRTFTTGVK